MPTRDLSSCARTVLYRALAIASLFLVFPYTASRSADEGGGAQDEPARGRPGGEPGGQITLDDLEYGRIDIDGDGRCTPGDDHQVRWLREKNPALITEALKSARRRADGAVDLSAFFKTDRFDGARIYEERLRKKLQSGQLTAVVVERWEDRENREAGRLGALGQPGKTVDYGIKLYATIVADGRPVEGADFFAELVDPERDAEGRARLSFDRRRRYPSRAAGLAEAAIYGTRTFEKGLEAYRFELGAYHPELGSAHRSSTYDELKSLAAGKLVLTLERGLTLVGRVVDKEGRPVPGAEVRLQSTSSEGDPAMSGLTVPSREDGSFTMAGIRFDNVPRSLEVVFEGAWPPPSPASPIARRRTERRAERRVSAQVPIPRAADRKAGEVAVPDIVLSLGSEAPSFSTRPVVAEGPTGRSSSPRSPGQVGRNVRFSGQVLVRVLAGGKPVAGAGVGWALARERSDGLVDKGDPFRGPSAQTTADGIALAAFNVTTSSYVGDPGGASIGVAAYHPEHGSAYGEINYGALKRRDNQQLVLELEQRLVLTGRAVDRKGAPVPDAQVELATICLAGSPSMSGISVRTRADGRFTLAGIGFENTPRLLSVSCRETTQQPNAALRTGDVARFLRARARGDDSPVSATISFGQEMQGVVGVIALPDVKLSMDQIAE